MKELSLIATCGMNCMLCMAYQRNKKHCPGCNVPDKNKSKSCSACVIKNCEELQQTKSGFCYSCSKFPCKRLKQLDIRYRTKYGMSMIQNLRAIEEAGIEKFVEMQKLKWTCTKCGSLLCVHRDSCQVCGNNNERFHIPILS